MSDAPLPANHPLMVAWNTYKATDDFANSVKWAPTHPDGSMWAAFAAGFSASADAARIRELEARQVPDGWQVVPKEPTEEMVEDAAKAIHDTDDMADTSWPVKDDDTGYRGGGGWVRLCRDPEMFREAARAAHSAMLAAAPRP